MRLVVSVGSLIAIILLFANQVLADIDVSIHVQDAATGKEISGTKVLIGTVGRVIAQYSDPSHGMQAEANLTVWLNDVFLETLFSGIISSGTVKIVDYTLSRVGTYKFRWQVGTEIDEAMVSTTVFVIPESPVGTLLGILAPIAALISIAFLRRPKMR